MWLIVVIHSYHPTGSSDGHIDEGSGELAIWNRDGAKYHRTSFAQFVDGSIQPIATHRRAARSQHRSQGTHPSLVQREEGRLKIDTYH